MSENAVLFLHALTGLHPGTGTALGTVDLPVQRERHTEWPTIAGSSLKGVLRDACRRRAGNGDRLFAAFGPETENAGDHAGALALTDARILAFPVRSLQGVFAWVTCPAVLERLDRDLQLAGLDGPGFPRPGKDRVACDPESPLLIDHKAVVLEEFEFSPEGPATKAAEWLSQHAVADAATAERLKTHLCVLHDDDFTHFVRRATEVTARIGLDYQTKTVRQGALFYQEFLPPETLFYSLVFASPSRRNGHEASGVELLDWLEGSAGTNLQIGGDQTTGKGLCAWRLQRTAIPTKED